MRGEDSPAGGRRGLPPVLFRDELRHLHAPRARPRERAHRHHYRLLQADPAVRADFHAQDGRDLHGAGPVRLRRTREGARRARLLALLLRVPDEPVPEVRGHRAHCQAVQTQGMPRVHRRNLRHARQPQGAQARRRPRHPLRFQVLRRAQRRFGRRHRRRQGDGGEGSPVSQHPRRRHRSPRGVHGHARHQDASAPGREAQRERDEAGDGAREAPDDREGSLPRPPLAPRPRGCEEVHERFRRRGIL